MVIIVAAVTVFWTLYYGSDPPISAEPATHGVGR